MDRPTKELVDRCLDLHYADHDSEDCILDNLSECVLATEVRALREELAVYRADRSLSGYSVTLLDTMPPKPEVTALVKAAREALDGYRGTLDSEWGPIEDNRWPKDLTGLEAALKPFEGSVTDRPSPADETAPDPSDE